jgi:hypothetical protein
MSTWVQDVLKLLPDEVAAKIDPAQFVRYFISGSTIYTVIDRPNNGGALCLQPQPPNHYHGRTHTTYHLPLTLASRRRLCDADRTRSHGQVRVGPPIRLPLAGKPSILLPVRTTHDTRHTRYTAHDVRES